MGLLEGVTAPDSRAWSARNTPACCDFYIAGKFPMFIVWVNERNVKKKGARDSFYFGTGRGALLLLWLTSRGNSPSRSKPAYFVRKGIFTQRAILALAEWTPGQRTVAA